MAAVPPWMGKSNNEPFDDRLFEWFELALRRLESGEALDKALSGCPAELQKELRAMLGFSEKVIDLRHVEMPARSPEHHTRAKAKFLAEARRLQPVAAPAKAPSLLARSATTMQQTIAVWSKSLHDTLSPRMNRLAPALAGLAAVAMVAVNVVQVAQAAVPGDATYPIKDWLRNVEVQLSAPGKRETVIARIEIETGQDIEKAVKRRRESVETLEAKRRLTYYGRNGRRLEIGGLIVLDGYENSANESRWTPIDIIGDLQPGAVVEVTFRILPGQSNFVQGVRIQVISQPAPPPTPIPPSPVPGSTATPVALPPTPTPLPPVQIVPPPCQPVAPTGWIDNFRVRSGDDLRSIALLADLSETAGMTELVEVNCLEDGELQPGQTIFVPDTPALRAKQENNALPTPTPQQFDEATPTAVLEFTETATATPVEPVDSSGVDDGSEPQATVTLQPVEQVTEVVAVTSEPNGEVTAVITIPTTISIDIIEATVTPTGEVTNAETPSITSSEAVTPVVEETAESSETPIATETVSSEATATFEAPPTDGQTPATDPLTASTEESSLPVEGTVTEIPDEDEATKEPPPTEASPPKTSVPVVSPTVAGTDNSQQGNQPTAVSPAVEVPTPAPPPVESAPTVVAPPVSEPATGGDSSGGSAPDQPSGSGSDQSGGQSSESDSNSSAAPTSAPVDDGSGSG